MYEYIYQCSQSLPSDKPDNCARLGLYELVEFSTVCWQLHAAARRGIKKERPSSMAKPNLAVDVTGHCRLGLG